MKTVYFSYALEKAFPHLTSKIRRTLSGHWIDSDIIISDCLWCRDWMPVNTRSGLVKFKYKTVSYDKWPQLKVPKSCWDNFKTTTSNIILDGGNVEQNESCVLMTEMVFKNNKDIKKNNLIKRLEKIFCKKIIFLPPEPGDTLGHIDGLARWWNENTVFINDFTNRKTKVWDNYQKRIEAIFSKNGIYIIRLPNAYNKMPKMSEKQFRKKYPLADDKNEAFGYYINFYRIGNVLFMPTFNIKEDDKAAAILRQTHPQCDIVRIDCSGLSLLGGLCNCVLWEN